MLANVNCMCHRKIENPTACFVYEDESIVHTQSNPVITFSMGNYTKLATVKGKVFLSQYDPSLPKITKRYNPPIISKTYLFKSTWLVCNVLPGHSCDCSIMVSGFAFRLHDFPSGIVSALNFDDRKRSYFLPYPVAC